jgi:hypothetical protein
VEEVVNRDLRRDKEPLGKVPLEHLNGEEEEESFLQDLVLLPLESQNTFVD